MPYQNRHVWIIGASSGIGQALAIELAQRGAILSLSARNEDALRSLGKKLGTKHQIIPFDVCDVDAVNAVVPILTRQIAAIDCVILLAGTYQPMTLSTLDYAKTQQIVQTNLLGALNVLSAVLPVLKRQGHGQIALCASVAGFCGLPNAQPYGATKAALINIAESLGSEMRGTGVDVRLINPGFVATPMTAINTFPMPMMIEPAQAAVALADGLMSSRFEILFPRRFTFLMKLLRLMPYWLYFRIMPR